MPVAKPGRPLPRCPEWSGRLLVAVGGAGVKPAVAVAIRSLLHPAVRRGQPYLWVKKDWGKAYTLPCMRIHGEGQERGIFPRSHLSDPGEGCPGPDRFMRARPLGQESASLSLNHW